MKRTIQIAVVLFALLPGIAKAQWTFDIVSVEAYINDHKKPLIGQHRAASEPGLFRDMAVHSSAHRLLESKGISLPHHAGDSR